MAKSTLPSLEHFDPGFFLGNEYTHVPAGVLPAPIIDHDFGDGHFDLKFPVRVTLQMNVVAPGVSVDIRVNFRGPRPDGTDATGSYYSQFSGIADANGAFADQNADYWLGFPGPVVPDAASWQCTIIVPDMVLPSGATLPSETIVTKLGGSSPFVGKSKNGYAYITMSEITRPPLQDGQWTCVNPSITLFNIIVIFIVPARPLSQTDMAQDHSSGHITIIKSVPAP